jgi:hypothetical protein
MADVEITPAPEPVKVLVVRYDCPFCGSGFRSSRKVYVAEHMTHCWSDPAKKTCRTCAFHVPPVGDFGDACRQLVDLPERSPVVNCPFWHDRDTDDAEELTAA